MALSWMRSTASSNRRRPKHDSPTAIGGGRPMTILAACQSPPFPFWEVVGAGVTIIGILAALSIATAWAWMTCTTKSWGG